MKRREFLSSVAAAATLPRIDSRAEGAAANTSPSSKAGVVPLQERRYDYGPVQSYLTAEEAADLEEFYAEAEAECPGVTAKQEPVEVSDVAFVPSGRWLVFIVEADDVPTLICPFEVPEEFGPWDDVDGQIMRHPGEWLTKQEAIAQMVAYNRKVIGRGGKKWALAFEIGEPQGKVETSLHHRWEDFSILNETRSSPVRVYRRRFDT